MILMDIDMPVMNGIDVSWIIHAEYPAFRVIGLSVYRETEQQTAMREAVAVA